MTKWFHKCDLDWLRGRQSFLTATDVKDLLPITKTGRKRTITDENYIKVLAGKLVGLTESDCVSTGAAARGHILEPYAIDKYNKVDYGNNEHLFHWDDIIVTRANNVQYSLAFSPDATDIDPHIIKAKQANGFFRNNAVAGIDIKTIGEIKSYSSERHMICGYTPKNELEERWQIATAMAVCPTIETAYLLFYNPSMHEQLYIVTYNRTDLTYEIDMVLEVERNWLVWLSKFKKLEACHYISFGPSFAETKIIESIMDSEKLNPEGERSVMR